MPAKSIPDATQTAANDRRTAERTERRRQRAQAHSAPAPARKPLESQQRERATDSKSALQQRARLTLRDSALATLIVLLVAGAVVGAILGAVGAANWVTGLLVAALTVGLSAALRSFTRSPQTPSASRR
jgi:Flp pilus assembly protein TadB